MAKKKSSKKPPSSKKKRETPAVAPVDEKAYATLQVAAAHCKVSPQTLRNYMLQYPDLPVHEKSVDGYKLDIEALDKWREENNLLNWTPKTLTGEGGKRLQPVKDRKAELQAELLQLELDQKKGLLIARDDVVKAFSTKIAQIAKRFDLMPSYVGRKANMQPEAIEIMRRYVDECRIALAQDNDGFFTAIEAEVAHDSKQLL